MLIMLFSCKTGENVTNAPAESIYSGYSEDYIPETTDRDTYEITDEDNETEGDDEGSFMPVIVSDRENDEPNEEIQEEEDGYSLKSLLSGDTTSVPVMVNTSSSEQAEGFSISSDTQEEGYDMLKEYMKSIEQAKPVTEPVSVANPAFINHEAENIPEEDNVHEDVTPVSAETVEEPTTFTYVSESESFTQKEKTEDTLNPEAVIETDDEKNVQNTPAEPEEKNDVINSSMSPVDFFNTGKAYWNNNYSVDSFREQDEARKQAEKDRLEAELKKEAEKEGLEILSYYSPDPEENTEIAVDDTDKKIAEEAARKDRELYRNFDWKTFVFSLEGLSCITVLVLFTGLIVIVRIRKKNK